MPVKRAVAMKVSAVILAAGTASRFGSDKRLARLPCGRRVLEATVARYLGAQLDCVVVLDQCDEQLQPVLRDLGADVVTLEGARSGCFGAGMGDSLAAGVTHAAVRGDVACLIALADMPWIRVETIRLLVDALKGELVRGPRRDAIIAPYCDGERGHPVGFGASHFAELGALRGDRGARSILQHHASRLVACPVTDAGVLRDIDTPSDLIK
jgi:molybdenum cofactor cytidylyltransferase